MARVLAPPSHDSSTGGVTGLVAKRLRQAREACGLSQRELGVRAGMDPSVASPRVNQYEQNRHTPNVVVLSQLANVLEQPLAYFYASDDELARLVTAFHRASKEQRQGLLGEIKRLLEN